MARPRVVTPRRRKQWSFIPAISINMSGDATVIGGSIAFGSGGQTVLRMIGEYTIGLSGAPVAGDDAFVVVAIGKVSTDAATLGATAMPDPAGEPDYPWLFWQSHGFRYNDAEISPDMANGSVRHAFDIRSQRKFGPGESLAMVFQYANDTGDPPLAVTVAHTRVLIALP